MSSFDLRQAQRHIELLRGNSEAQVHFQLFVDDKSAHIAQDFYGNLTQYGNHLMSQQNCGMGVYVTVNPTNGAGRKETDLTSIDWCFADFDNTPLPQQLPLTPLFITQRDTHHSHLYWPIADCEDNDQFKALQRRIAMYLGSDEQVIDPTRVLRLAGTMNLKDRANPAMYYITQDNTSVLGDDFAYTPDEIINAFVLQADKEIELKQWVESQTSLDNGAGYNENPAYRQKLINFLTDKAEPAVKGMGRSHKVIKVMSLAQDLGIPLEEAQQIGWEYYNPRIEPPYCESERSKKWDIYVERAYKYANNAVGCRTAGAVFKGCSEVMEPQNGWNGNAEKAPEATITWNEDNDLDNAGAGIFGYITEEQAAINAVSITNKSPVMDIAMHFMGLKYPEKKLLRCEKTFYEFNGRSWDIVDEDDIRGELVKFLAQWKFPPSKISQIFTYITDICQTRGLEQGKWLNNQDKNGKDTVAVKNGLLEITKDGTQLLPHTRDFFILNCLEYDYNPNAKCDEWLEMLERIWPGDNDTKAMLQEWFGYNLVVDNRFDFYAQLIGKSRGGKGTITSVLEKMIGEHNICSPNIEGIIQDHIIHNMSVTKSAIIPEANAVHHSIRDRVLNQLKSMTGGDSIEFNRKYKSAATGKNWAKITISSNSMPEFIDSSGALVNRALIFPFFNTFVGKEDRGLKKRLYGEVAGILNWSIVGLMRLMQNGKFTRSALSNEVQDDMRYDTFPLAGFVEHSCDIIPGSQTLVDDLYKQYLYYCDQSGNKGPLSSYKFSRHLRDSALPVTKRRQTSEGREYVFNGICIKESAKKPQFTNVTPINPSVKIPVS